MAVSLSLSLSLALKICQIQDINRESVYSGKMDEHKLEKWLKRAKKKKN